MGSYQKSIKSRFGFISKFYDIFDIVFSFNKNTNPRYGLAERIPDGNLRILDVCAGTANTSIIIAKKNPQNEIIGIDLSPDMLAVAENKIRTQRLKNIRLQPMDAIQMTFQDGEFDITTISFALHELKYDLMVKVLREMFRTLKVGGKMYIIDYDKQNNPVKNVLLSIFLKIFEPPHMQQFLQYNWRDILKDIGFNSVQIEKYRFSKIILTDRTIQQT